MCKVCVVKKFEGIILKGAHIHLSGLILANHFLFQILKVN